MEICLNQWWSNEIYSGSFHTYYAINLTGCRVHYCVGFPKAKEDLVLASQIKELIDLFSRAFFCHKVLQTFVNVNFQSKKSYNNFNVWTTFFLIKVATTIKRVTLKNWGVALDEKETCNALKNNENNMTFSNPSQSYSRAEPFICYFLKN